MPRRGSRLLERLGGGLEHPSLPLRGRQAAGRQSQAPRHTEPGKTQRLDAGRAREVRFYVSLPAGTRVRDVTLASLQAHARAVLRPYDLTIARGEPGTGVSASTSWWSAYSIGQRLAIALQRPRSRPRLPRGRRLPHALAQRHGYAYPRYGVECGTSAIVAVRPDQYVSHVGSLDDLQPLGDLFGTILQECSVWMSIAIVVCCNTNQSTFSMTQKR